MGNLQEATAGEIVISHAVQHSLQSGEFERSEPAATRIRTLIREATRPFDAAYRIESGLNRYLCYDKAHMALFK
jgi:hypothetical protein